jgi:hypothetical protein
MLMSTINNQCYAKEALFPLLTKEWIKGEVENKNKTKQNKFVHYQ